MYSSLCFAVYGVDLTTLVKLEGGVIPQILDDLFTEIQSRGEAKWQGVHMHILWVLYT